jgi:hypothetical protein
LCQRRISFNLTPCIPSGRILQDEPPLQTLEGVYIMDEYVWRGGIKKEGLMPLLDTLLI